MQNICVMTAVLAGHSASDVSVANQSQQNLADNQEDENDNSHSLIYEHLNRHSIIYDEQIVGNQKIIVQPDVHEQNSLLVLAYPSIETVKRAKSSRERVREYKARKKQNLSTGVMKKTERAKTSTERSRDHRARIKTLIAKTSKKRVREYRARTKQNHSTAVMKKTERAKTSTERSRDHRARIKTLYNTNVHQLMIEDINNSQRVMSAKTTDPSASDIIHYDLTSLEDTFSSTSIVPIEVEEEKDTVKTNDNLKFKKRLIAQVQRHHILYDPKHKNFPNVAEKEQTWLKIATALATEVNVCKNTWIDLRYNYQRYARRLRKFFHSGKKKTKRRPVMTMENEMLFLWRFVANKSLYPLPTNKSNNNKNATKVTTTATTQPRAKDHNIALVKDDPIVIIDLDGDDEINTKQNNAFIAHTNLLITHEVRRLVDLIKAYPELYNSKHRYFNDFKRKGIIWNAIANELNDKGTKLMKCWLHLQTRYEWELINLDPSTETELQKFLEFLSPHMPSNPNTVYKHAFFLKKNWQEPIEHFKNIFSLLAVMKKMPRIVTLTDEMLYVDAKNDEYFQLWNDIAKIRGSTMGVCETTWLILRSFYWELMTMRKHSYQLQDKWYFESIIAKLYALAEAAKHKPPPVMKPMLKTPVNLDEYKILPSKIEMKQHQSLNSTTSTQTSLLKKNQVKVPRILSVQSLSSPQINVVKTYAGCRLKTKPIASPAAATPAAFNAGVTPSLPINSTPSSIGLNKNIVPIKFPYQLPQNIKVTPFTPSKASNVSTAITSVTNGVTIKPAVENITLNTATPNPDIVAIKQTPVLPTLAPMGEPACKPILPKITGAVSILYPNEIIIELISSPYGNQLIVRGPPLSKKYSISMDKTAKFIRYVMAIPVLHNKIINQQAQANSSWDYLSKIFSLPVDICKAIWNFLSENFNHFPQIAPMDDLMKPCKIGIEVWRESHGLFDSFQEMSVQAGYRIYKERLPELMRHIGLYFTLTKQKELNLSIASFEPHIDWVTLREIFAEIDKYKMIEMWMAFKKVFWNYMGELERGIDNKWPQEWWRVLAKMRFLMELRYHNQEPFYYIVRNKIIEEIERCNRQENKINETIKEVKRLYLLDTQKPKALSTVTPSPPPIILPVLPTKSNSFMNYATHSSANKTLSTSQPLVSILPESSSSSSLEAQSGIPKLQNRGNIDPYMLILAIRRHPEIYHRCRSSDKIKAWKDVALELNSSISACRLAFQRAVIKYRTYVARDPASICCINQKYFKHLNEIYRVVKSKRQLNIETATELNQVLNLDLTESTKINFPEHFILDINMSNSKPSLVMKNWAYAIRNISQNTDQVFEKKLRRLFNKFLSSTNF